MAYKYNYSHSENHHYFLKGLLIFIVVGCILYWLLGLVAPKSRNSIKDEISNNIFGPDTDSVANKPKTKVINPVVPNEPGLDDKIKTSIPIEIKDKEIMLEAIANGVPLKFTLDTGCTGVQLTWAEIKFMEHKGIITDKDYLGESTGVLADGTEIKIHNYKLRTLQILGKTLNNVECHVTDNPDASLLIGHTVLSQLGKITIDYNNKQLYLDE